VADRCRLGGLLAVLLTALAALGVMTPAAARAAGSATFSPPATVLEDTNFPVGFSYHLDLGPGNGCILCGGIRMAVLPSASFTACPPAPDATAGYHSYSLESDNRPDDKAGVWDEPGEAAGTYLFCGYFTDEYNAVHLTQTALTVTSAADSLYWRRVPPQPVGTGFYAALDVTAQVHRGLSAALLPGARCQPLPVRGPGALLVGLTASDVEGQLTVVASVPAVDTAGRYVLCAYLTRPADGSTQITASTPITVGAGPAASCPIATSRLSRQSPAHGCTRSKPLLYVALGDSYSSGEGNPNNGWTQLGDNPAGDRNSDVCHRSASAYPDHLLLPAATRRLSLACTGDATQKVLHDQLPYLDPHADLITLTVGGDDADFGDVVQACVVRSYTPDIAAAPGRVGRSGQGPVHPTPIIKLRYLCHAPDSSDNHKRYVHEVNRYIDRAVHNVLDAIRRIHARAPHALVVVGDYPRLLSPIEGTDGCGVVDDGQGLLLARAEAMLNRGIAHDVQTAEDTLKRSRHDPRAQIVLAQVMGNGHEACYSQHPWINNGIPSTQIGLSDVMGVLHPNGCGQLAYADAFNDAIDRSELARLTGLEAPGPSDLVNKYGCQNASAPAVR